MISCSSLTTTNPKLEDLHISKEILQECEDLSRLEVGSKKEVILYIFDIKSQYIKCKEKHKALSNSIIEVLE